MSRLHLWAIEDVWGVLVEDDRLPVEVAGTGHRQEGHEEEGDHGEGGKHQNGAPAVQDQDWWSWCATGLVSAAWLPPPQRLPWMVVGASGGVRGRRLPA